MNAQTARPNTGAGIATSNGAAFFDLDRTLLAGASGTVFSSAMHDAGFTSRRIPGENALFRVFNAIGETLPSMALARAGARVAKGRSREAVQRAGQAAAAELAALVQPLAATVFAEHRRPGAAAGDGHHLALRPRRAARQADRA